MATTTKPHMGNIDNALAAELVDMICEKLETNDFLSLRMVCRDMKNKSDDAFLNRFFIHRRQLITEYSLQSFLAMTKQRRLLSKLKSVDFVLVALEDSKYWWLNQQRAHKILCNKNDDGNDDSDDDQNSDAKDSDAKDSDEEDGCSFDSVRLHPKVVDAKNVVYARWDTQLKNLGNLLELNHITSALKNLKNNDIYPALLVSSGVWYNGTEFGVKPAYGIRRLHQDLCLDPEDYHPKALRKTGDRSPFIEDMACGQDGTKLLLKSIAEADFPIQDLTASSTHLHSCFTDLDLNSLNTRLHSNMAGLRRLSLSLDDKIMDENLDTFSSFLAVAPCLEHLALEFDIDSQLEDDGNMPSNFSSAFTPNKLSSIKMSWACFEQDDLESLLYSQQGSLKRLEFSYATLKDDKDWEPTFYKMAEDLDLTYMEIVIRRGCYSDVESGICKGGEEVKKGFAGLIELNKGSTSDDEW